MDKIIRPPGTDHEPTLTEDIDAARARHPAWTIRVAADTGRICSTTPGMTVDCGDVLQVDRVIAEAEHIAALRERLAKRWVA
jgi:hypothetical protein